MNLVVESASGGCGKRGDEYCNMKLTREEWIGAEMPTECSPMKRWRAERSCRIAMLAATHKLK